MSHEEIEKKAFEAYPVAEKVLGYESGPFGIFDMNDMQREGYIKALEEIEELPKIKGWVARDGDGELSFYECKPKREKVFHYWKKIGWFADLNRKNFRDLTWADNPIQVELLIRKI